MNEKTAQKIDEIVQKQKDALIEAEKNKETGEIIVQISLLTGGISNVFITKRKKI